MPEVLRINTARCDLSVAGLEMLARLDLPACAEHDQLASTELPGYQSGTLLGFVLGRELQGEAGWKLGQPGIAVEDHLKYVSLVCGAVHRGLEGSGNVEGAVCG